MSIVKNTRLPNVLLILGMMFIGYATYTHLNRPDISDGIRMLWQLQEISNNEEMKASLMPLVSLDSYMKNIVKAQNDPSVNLIHQRHISNILTDTTLTDLDKVHAILKEDLNKVIKMNYGKFIWKEDKVSFEMLLRDVCTGDFKLEVEAGNEQIEKLLLYHFK